MKHINIPIFVPHEGCPHDCSFCNQRKITGNEQKQSKEEIRAEIEKILIKKTPDSEVEIAFFGGSFTGIDESRQKELLSIAAEYKAKGLVCGIRLSTRPDYINPHILDYLKNYGVTDIELGVQSMDDAILNANNRGHSVECVISAAELIKSYNCFGLGLQQMPGLYMSNPEKDIESAKKIAALKPHNTRIYPTIVLEGTYLYKLCKMGKYVPYTVEQAVSVSSEIYKICRSEGIEVIRIGLQSTDIINEKNVIGPYHSSFGELVISRVLRDEIESKLSGNEKQILVYAPLKYVSKIIGNKRCNVLYFKEKYNLELKIVKDEKDCNIKVTNI